jgi:hypothetical protein
MTAPTRRQLMAGSLAAIGAAGAPAIAEAKAHAHLPPTAEEWGRFWAAWWRMTMEEQREVLAYGEELLAEQEGRTA